MPAEEFAIQLTPVPPLWPPLRQEAAGPASAPPYPGDGRPSPPVPAPEQGPALPRQFAMLLAEVLAGVRPPRQIAPWLSQRGALHLHRLIPLCRTGHQPRVLRVLATRPAPDVIEMTIIAAIGPRPRALAIRLEHTAQPPHWLCTDIESG